MILLSSSTLTYSFVSNVTIGNNNNRIQFNATKAKRIERMSIEPKFFLIGAQKAGTTSLYQFLTHSSKNICMATGKELHYFNHFYHRGSLFYQKFFKSSCNVSDGVSGYIDGTPDYYKRREVPYKMNETFVTLADKKIVFVLREPIAREFSWYEHLIRNCAKYLHTYMTSHPSQIPDVGSSWDPQHLQFLCGEHLDRNGNHHSGHCHQVNCLLKGKWIRPKNITRSLPTFKEYFETVNIDYENSRYIHHIQNFVRYFDRKQILILSFDYLTKNTTRSIRSIFKHFGVVNSNLESTIKLPHSNEARVDAVLDCDTHYKMRKYFDSYNKQLYEYLDNRTGPSYEPPFGRFVYSKCKDYNSSRSSSPANSSINPIMTQSIVNNTFINTTRLS